MQLFLLLISPALALVKSAVVKVEEAAGIVKKKDVAPGPVVPPVLRSRPLDSASSIVPPPSEKPVELAGTAVPDEVEEEGPPVLKLVRPPLEVLGAEVAPPVMVVVDGAKEKALVPVVAPSVVTVGVKDKVFVVVVEVGVTPLSPALVTVALFLPRV